MDLGTAVITDEIVKGVVDQIKHQFSYLSQYHNNIRNLSSKLKILEDRREDVQDKVNVARNDSQIIKDGVYNWLERVEVIKAEAEGLSKDKDKVGNGCWKGWCLNLKLRYQLSRKVVKEALPELDKLLTEFDPSVPVAKTQLPLGVVYVPKRSSEIEQATCADNKKKTVRAVEIQGDEKSENSASFTAAQHVPKGIASSSKGTRSGLESRLLVLGDVMEAVKDEKIRIVRICGMGGVGKTTMAKEVEKMAREQLLFHEIAMVEVNQDPDPRSIQLHIAELLGLHLKEDDVKAGATRLYNRLNDERQNGKGQHDEKQNDQRQNGEGQNDQRPNDGGEKKRILIILDNVWKREDLEGIGIPLGDEQRCKILLTSRHDDVCKNIAPEKEFKIEVLSDPEARILFSQSLGNSHCYDQIAEELVNACAGLPISIKTIARAVANKKKVEWTVALRKLQKSALEGEYPAVFNCLKVSYDFLKNEDIKKFFRLCCLFRKGSEVPIEDLARYGIALRLFQDKLYEARDEAHRNVAILLNSNLLLGSDQKECVKVHDHVWDFAVSISDNGLFMVNYSDGLKEWPRRDSYEDYTSISLLCSEMNVVPEGMTCRNLELLQLTGEGYTTLRFPEKFYEGMRRLNVLAFRSMNVPLTQVSLKLLTNLRTLSLHQCSLGNDISMIGNLEKLEVLSFAYSNIMELPTVIVNLKQLRLLDLTRCEIHIIAHGVLSSLISLEELYMRGTSLCCGDKVQATFTEIASLSKLVVIDIEIPLEVLPMDTLFKKLEKFKISIDKYERSEAEYLFPNSLDLKCDLSVLLQDGIKLLVQETERMYLEVTGLKTLLDHSETWDFSNLKSLSLVRCNELVYFINSEHKIEFRSLKYLSLKDLPNLVGFCKARDIVEFPQLEELELDDLPLLTSLDLETETSASGHSHASSSHPFFNKKGRHTICRFQNLRSLRVKYCHSLTHISTPSTAISFGELQQLEVTMCHSLQAIVAAEGREIEEEEEEEENAKEGRILLPELNHLHLDNLPNLSTIVPKGYTLRWSSLKKLKVHYCGTKSDIFTNTNTVRGLEIALTSLEELNIWRMKSTELWLNHFPGGGNFSYKLRNMEMSNCKKLLVLFSPHLVPGFHYLERLYLDNCKSLEVVFDLGELTVEGVHKFAMLNKLDSIAICDQLSMTHVWNKVPRNFEGFNNLTSLYVQKCHSLGYLFSPSIAKCLVKLHLVNVEDCSRMEEVVSKRDEECQKNVVDMVFFPQLQQLTLSVLPNIKCFGPNIGSTKTHHNVNANTSISSPVFDGKIALTSSEDMENRGTNSMELWRDNYAGGFSCGLRRMIVKDCHNLLVLFPHFIQVFHHLEKLDISKCNTLKVVFDLEGVIVAGKHKVVILGQLYEMDLYFLPRMTHVWKNVPKDFKGFHNLISLSVRYCDGLSYLFTPLIAKCLVKLVKVLVRKCEVMEEVVSKRDEKCEEDKRNAIDDMILLPKLEQLELEDLQSLISLGPRAYAFDKQSFGAPNDGSDVTHDQGNPNSSIPTPIFNEKIALTTSMEDVEIRGTNSTELWRDQFAGRRFYYGWRRIRLNGCHKLSVLFTSHLIQGFYCLEKLQASRCDSLEVVFDLEKLMVGGGEHRVVMLNQLDQIQISYLPRMTHVWKKAPINFEGFHNLTNVEIDNCGSLRYLFSPLIAKCLVKLRKLSVEECGEMEEVVSRSWDEEEDGEEDQRNAVDIIFFPKLHELELSSLPSLVCFGPGGAPDAFDRLSLEAPNVLGSTNDIHHEGNFNTSISSPTFTEELPFSGPQSSNLPSLALVQIGRCQLPAWSLYNLTRVKVHECHKLLYLFPHNIVVRLPVLQHLSISNCDNMKYVFCSSTVRSLAQLRYLSIVGCKMMEVVVKEEDEVEADRWSKLVVPSLISLMLTSLPNLGGICFGMLAFEWPSLTSLVIKFCWKMRIFTSGYSSTPILDSVLVNSNRHILEKGDLNTTLTSVEQKDPDNIAFKEEGTLTSNGFLVAGMYLASKCRSWYWKTDRRHKDRERIWDDLREFLITKNVPCLTRARASSSIVVEEDKNEADECGDGDDKNIPRPRTYSVSITYDEEDKIPRLWLKGFDESKRVLPPELVHEDIAELHPQEFITVEMHPQLHEKQVSLYGDLTPRHIKDFSDNLAKQGFQPNVKHYLQLLLELYAPRIPTIQYCFRGA